MVSSILLLWALVGLIGRVHGKCSLTPIADNERSIAYACIHGDLNDLDELSSETEWIEFSVSRFYAIPDDAFHRFKNLRRLSFYNCHVNVVRPNAFRGLRRLDWLIFHGTRIHAVKTAWFQDLPLRRLILDRCGLVYIESNVFRMLPQLEVLSLRDNDLDCLPMEELSYLRRLRTVRIDGNPWLCECRRKMEKFFCERSIVQEKECKVQLIVHPSFQCMTQFHIPILPPAINIDRIQNYEDYGNHFQTSALTSLERLPDRTTWIEIRGLRIDYIPAYTFFRFGNSLHSLELRDCFIGTIEHGAFAGLHQLQRLTLIGNRLPIPAAHWFRDLVALRQLVLANNSIEQIEPGTLRPLTGSLRHLDIRYNRLRCLPVNELTQLSYLERLDAVGNLWNCECLNNLQRALTAHNIGFEISVGRCHANKIVTDSIDKEWYRTDLMTTSVLGQVHWTSFEDMLYHERNMTIRPTTEVYTEASRPPIYRGTCIPDMNEKSRQVFVCSGITSLQKLSSIPHTAHTIRIIFSNLKMIPTRAFARFNGYLSKLELRDCNIETIEHRAFVDLHNLQQLSLHNNRLESITSETLEGLINLHHLDLSHNHIYRITNDALDMLPRLCSLDISENYMNCINVEHIAHKLPYLNTFKVSGNPWSCLCGSKLASFLDSRRIPYNREFLFNINECYIDGTFTTPPTMITTSRVTTTEPPSVPVPNESIQGRCTVQQDPMGSRYRCIGGNLQLLQTIPNSVISIEFYDGHLPYLPASSFYRFANLQELTIRNCGLKTIQVGTFRGLDSLERLAIQYNPLTSIEKDWFDIKRLERLDLRGNSIRYIAPGAFHHLRKLVYLNLEGNDLQCIFTSDLNEMPELHIVEFAGNPLKWRCRMDLEQFLEMRKIKFVKVENSCEGKQIVRNLLYENRTVEEMECRPSCSMASQSKRGKSFIFFVTFALLFTMQMY